MGLILFLSTYCRSRGFQCLVAFGKIGKGVIGRLFWLPRPKWGIGLRFECKVEYGFYIGHDGPVIVNITAVISSNVTPSQFTTIGSGSCHAVTIGEKVYIGPNVCFVEDVTIGSNATIGARSVVAKDIPESATTAGNYAKELNCNNPCRFVANRWRPSSKN